VQREISVWRSLVNDSWADFEARDDRVDGGACSDHVVEESRAVVFFGKLDGVVLCMHTL
jgi:hypothetical protein